MTSKNKWLEAFAKFLAKQKWIDDERMKYQYETLLQNIVNGGKK